VDRRAAVNGVSFSRVSGSPPPARALLEVHADGSWTAWRSIGLAVGRFAAEGGAESPGARIIELGEATAGADAPELGDQPLDTTIDRVAVDGRSVAVGYRAEPDGPWGELLAACRELLDKATDHPVAAIGLAIVAPDRLRLEHHGEMPIRVDLSGLRGEGTVWTDAGEYLARGVPRLGGDEREGSGGQVEAGPGWSADIVLEGLDPSTPGNLVVTMTLAVEDNGQRVPVALSAGRAPG
jgi:hypothetical protein